MKKWLMTILCVFVCGIIVFFVKENDIKYDLVGSYRVKKGADFPRWRAITPEGFYTLDMYENEYKLTTQRTLQDDFVLNENAVYVVCYGCTLERLTYREWQVSGRFSSSHPDYYSIAYLKPSEESNIVYIYKVNSVRVEKDPHSGDHSAVIVN